MASSSSPQEKCFRRVFYPTTKTIFLDPKIVPDRSRIVPKIVRVGTDVKYGAFIHDHSQKVRSTV